MKISQKRLNQIIKEEVVRFVESNGREIAKIRRDPFLLAMLTPITKLPPEERLEKLAEFLAAMRLLRKEKPEMFKAKAAAPEPTAKPPPAPVVPPVPKAAAQERGWSRAGTLADRIKAKRATKKKQ